MKFRDILYFFLLEGFFLGLTSNLLQADGLRLGELRQKSSSEIGQPTPVQRINNDVTKAPRLDLPPFIPGEEVKDGSGRRLRVWSTSGGLATSPPNSPQRIPSADGENSTSMPAIGSITIDKRRQDESSK